MAKGNTRICNRCRKTKLLTDFVFNKRSGNYLNYCIDCDKKYHKEYYERRKAINANRPIKISRIIKKRCIECGAKKPLTDFYFDRANGKLNNTCKACKRLAVKKYYEENRDKILEYAHGYRASHKERLDEYFTNYYAEHAEQRKEYAKQYNNSHRDEIKTKREAYYLANKDKFLERDKKYAQTHKEQIAERYKKWRKENAERLADYNRKYRVENADAIREQRKEYGKKNRKSITASYVHRRSVDPLFKLSTQVRGLIRISLKKKGYGKDTHTYDILGCDYETLWHHLKKTWRKNYGKEWDGEPYHIDHIIPLATAKSEQEVKELCYYKNLQLLKPHDNLSKNKRLEWSLDDNKEGENGKE